MAYCYISTMELGAAVFKHAIWTVCVVALSFSAKGQQAGGLLLDITVDDVSCFGEADGSASVVAAGGTAPYSYLWDGIGTDSVVSGLDAGIHTLMVTDQFGATATESFDVWQPDSIGFQLSSQYVNCPSNQFTFDTTMLLICNVTTLIPTNYTVVWSNGWIDTVQALTIGYAWDETFQVTITDTNGCSVSGVIEVNTPDSMEVDFGVTVGELCTSSATASITGGLPPITYSWSPSGATAATATDLCDGYHVVSVTDSIGCVVVDSVLVLNPLLGLTTADNEHLQVYPNPSSGFFEVETEGTQGIDGYRVVDSYGRVIVDRAFETPMYRLANQTALAEGVYYLQVRLTDEEVIRKLVVTYR